MPVPAEDYATQIAVRADGSAGPPGWPERSPFPTHVFVGGSTHTLELLKAFRTVLGIEGSTSVAGFDAKIAETRELLSTRTATLALDELALDDSTLEVAVRITNNTGHKLPTSYPSRRMWLHLRVVDAAGATVFESGRPDARGRLSVDTAALQHECLEVPKTDEHFDYPSCYEPHRNEIDDEDQVAVYESVLGDVNGRVTYVLLHAALYLKDNRLPPKGFMRTAVPTDGTTEIVGLAASDADFSVESGAGGSGADVVHYHVEVGTHPGPYRVEAELLYQSVRPAFVYGLHADDEPRVARYKEMYEAIPPTVETLASVSGQS